jgi:hypothetical protein
MLAGDVEFETSALRVSEGGRTVAVAVAAFVAGTAGLVAATRGERSALVDELLRVRLRECVVAKAVVAGFVALIVASSRHFLPPNFVSVMDCIVAEQTRNVLPVVATRVAAVVATRVAAVVAMRVAAVVATRVAAVVAIPTEMPVAVASQECRNQADLSTCACNA